MCANENQIRDIAIVDKKTERIIKEFMPGPITLILKKKDNLPNYITNDKDTIAIRIATSIFLKELIIKIEGPVFMTSANKSGETTCTSLDEIAAKCPFLDGIVEGNVVFREESTIVDCSMGKIKILRKGPISIE